MESVVQLTAIPARNYIASQVTLDFIAAAFVIVRIGTNCRHFKRPFLEDYLCIIAVLFIVSNSVTTSMMKSTFESDPESITVAFITRLAAACIFTATAAMYFAKLPILVLIIRTFGIKKLIRYASYSLMIITGLGFLASTLYTVVHCSPGLHHPDGKYLLQCVEATFYTRLSRSALSLAVDIAIFILPLPTIAKLKLPGYEKLGVALVFLMGIFCIIASVVSLYYQFGQAAKMSSNITNAMVATSLECCIMVIVGCSAALRLLWIHHLRHFNFSIRLCLKRSAPTPPSKAMSISNAQQGITNGISSPIRVTTDHYFQLSDSHMSGLSGYEARAHGGRDQIMV